MSLQHPDHPALVVVSGDGDTLTTRTYRELDRASARLYNLLVSRGCRAGDTIAYCLKSSALLVEAIWAAQRGGFYFTVVNPKLSSSDLDHVIRTSSARVLLVDACALDWARTLVAQPWAPPNLWFAGDAPPGLESVELLLEGLPDTPPDVEREGSEVVFSSGTTGRPKGVRRELPASAAGQEASGLIEIMKHKYDFGPDNVYLATAPLHHGGSLRYLLMGGRVGLTTVVMDRFDPRSVLRVIEEHGVTHIQVVPTMMVRIMKLTSHERAGFDMRSLRYVFHSGAPCPPEIKRQMLEWLGPIVHEGYAASDGPLVVTCTPEEWCRRPGTVGRPLFGRIHICDQDGAEVPVGTVGKVWFSGGLEVKYLDEDDNVAASRDDRGWSTVGDLGFVDDDGYLFLRGRDDGIAIINGVNVFPQDTEHALITHPSVLDASVVAEPDPERGESLHAYVQCTDSGPDPASMRAILMKHCRRELGALQLPRVIDIVDALPRDDVGKLRLPCAARSAPEGSLLQRSPHL